MALYMNCSAPWIPAENRSLDSHGWLWRLFVTEKFKKQSWVLYTNCWNERTFYIIYKKWEM